MQKRTQKGPPYRSVGLNSVDQGRVLRSEGPYLTWGHTTTAYDVEHKNVRWVLRPWLYGRGLTGRKTAAGSSVGEEIRLVLSVKPKPPAWQYRLPRRCCQEASSEMRAWYIFSMPPSPRKQTNIYIYIRDQCATWKTTVHMCA